MPNKPAFQGRLWNLAEKYILKWAQYREIEQIINGATWDGYQSWWTPPPTLLDLVQKDKVKRRPTELIRRSANSWQLMGKVWQSDSILMLFTIAMCPDSSATC